MSDKTEEKNSSSSEEEEEEESEGEEGKHSSEGSSTDVEDHDHESNLLASKRKLSKKKKIVKPKDMILTKLHLKKKGVVPAENAEAGSGGTSEENEIKKASVETVLEKLHTSAQGLDDAEVKIRLEQYGPNKLQEKHTNPVIMYLKFFWGPLSWVMELAAFIAFILGDWVDTLVISGLLFINATIGWWEEHNAGNAIAALKNQLAPSAMAMRNGKFSSVTAVDLVPGDIIHLAGGNVVPADVKLVSEDPVKIDQAALTGESLPVTKTKGNVCYAGSAVKSGECEAVVYATGSKTFFGRAAALVSGTASHGHFQLILKQIGYFCIIFIVIFVIVELIVQFGIRRKGCSGLDWEKGKHCVPLSNMLVLLVGGIPIAMPTVLSVTMALGAHQLAKKQAVVARLTAVEELAGMDILCSDKTGTLTLNKLTIKEPVPFDQALDDEHVVQEVVDDGLDEDGKPKKLTKKERKEYTKRIKARKKERRAYYKKEAKRLKIKKKKRGR